MSPPLVAVVAGACVVGAVGGAVVPSVIARLPEPSPEAEATQEDIAVGQQDEPDKLPYALLARARHLRWWCAAAGLAVAGVIAGELGWSAALPAWLYLAVLSVALGYVDWRTRLLPTALVAPSYVVVGVLLLLASGLSDDWHAALRALIGWVTTGGLFYALWFIRPAGMGYGDVRLSGVLGMALAWLGWAELLVGVYSGFILGALIGGGLAIAKVVDRKSYPFGPFMLAGAVVGVVLGPVAAGWYTG